MSGRNLLKRWETRFSLRPTTPLSVSVFRLTTPLPPLASLSQSKQKRLQLRPQSIGAEVLLPSAHLHARNPSLRPPPLLPLAPRQKRSRRKLARRKVIQQERLILFPLCLRRRKK